MLGTASILAALAVGGPLRAAGAGPALFIFDSRIARAREAAAAYRAAGVPALDRNRHDLGQAWRGRIRHLVEARRGSIAGLTLWTDSYICEAFGRENGLAMWRSPIVPGDDLHAWSLG
jgi:hypothetical protein